MITHSITTFSDFAAQLRENIHFQADTRIGGENKQESIDFNQLALDLFALQFQHNAPYRHFCQSRKNSPQQVREWFEIPAVPTAAFKEWEFTSLPATQRKQIFHSSGTTEQRPSRHFHNAESLSIYEASLLPWFATNVLGNTEKPSFLFLTPPGKDAPHSSLVHMFETIRREYGSPDSCFTGAIDAEGVWNLDLSKTVATLHQFIAKKQPLLVMGTAFNFVHLLDHFHAENIRLQLPEHSLVLETGGYKGRSRSLPKTELHALINAGLDVSRANIICEYGMSELSSQAYDSAPLLHRHTERAFHFPPWARIQIISPETGREVNEGETGLIRIFDLANVYSVLAIQTEDLGVRRGDGFELLGRAALSEPRGCSLQSS